MSKQEFNGSDSVIESRYKYETVLCDATKNYLDYKEWAINNPELVNQHISRYFGKYAVNGSVIDSKMRFKDEARYFSIINFGTLLSDKKENKIAYMADKAKKHVEKSSIIERVKESSDKMDYLKTFIGQAIPELKDSEELDWLEQKFDNLYRILPEFVIKDGGMSKAVKTAMGVITLASVDSMGQSKQVRGDRLKKAIRPAYYFGATYPLVDDILLDSDYVKGGDKIKYHDSIMKCFREGKSIDISALPDHPLAEEMCSVYDGILNEFPFDQNREIYDALEAEYLSQYNDANLQLKDIKSDLDVYPMISVKAAMSRIVPNLFAGVKISEQNSNHILNTILRNQFFDDMRDFKEDKAAGRLTPYTIAIQHPEIPIGNPLEKTLSYEAYISNVIFNDSTEKVAESLAGSGASFITAMMCGNDDMGNVMKKHLAYGKFGSDIEKLIEEARDLAPSNKQNAYLRTDEKFLNHVAEKTKNRDPQIVSPQTYISDSVGDINKILSKEFSADKPVEEVARYIIDAGGKRVRPALTLMLAESLGIDRSKVDPLLIYAELSHASSLIFDDLPAQDNASMRRGRPTAHIKYPEYDAQLAGISMMAHGLGVLGRLSDNFPANNVNKVVEYVGVELGSKLCLGQHIDLKGVSDANLEQVLDMYYMKTSVTIEGSLIPLMILEGRPEAEIRAIKDYAYHAGLVFQIQDDILDKTSNAKITGKDSGADVNKQNVVNLIGLEEARGLLEEHRLAAITACGKVDFPTGLLQNLVNYFGTRKN